MRRRRTYRNYRAVLAKSESSAAKVSTANKGCHFILKVFFHTITGESVPGVVKHHPERCTEHRPDRKRQQQAGSEHEPTSVGSGSLSVLSNDPSLPGVFKDCHAQSKHRLKFQQWVRQLVLPEQPAKAERKQQNYRCCPGLPKHCSEHPEFNN